MELIDVVPEFNLYEEFWKVYTKGDIIPPDYIGEMAVIDRCIMGEGTEVYGEIHNSVIGSGVRIEEGAVVRDSIVMKNTFIGRNTILDKAIVAENVTIGADCVVGTGEEAPNVYKPNIYAFGIATIGENSVIPAGVTIGRNTAIIGETCAEDYVDSQLASGGVIIKDKAGDEA